MHSHDFDWIEEPGYQSRVLEWVRLCPCGYSPDRFPIWRVLVTGSRKLTDGTPVWDALDAELAEHGAIVVIEGQADGADTAAMAWAMSTEGEIYLESYPANWRIGKIAGSIRNQQMVNSGADVCLAFPTVDSRGTWDCVRRAEEAGIPVKVFDV